MAKVKEQCREATALGRSLGTGSISERSAIVQPRQKAQSLGSEGAKSPFYILSVEIISHLSGMLLTKRQSFTMLGILVFILFTKIVQAASFKYVMYLTG